MSSPRRLGGATSPRPREARARPRCELTRVRTRPERSGRRRAAPSSVSGGLRLSRRCNASHPVRASPGDSLSQVSFGTLRSSVSATAIRVLGADLERAMGAVYRARRRRDRRRGRAQAVDQPRTTTSASRSRRGCSSSLQHPRVVRIVDHFAADSGQYLVMELVRGIDLGVAAQAARRARTSRRRRRSSTSGRPARRSSTCTSSRSCTATSSRRT